MLVYTLRRLVLFFNMFVILTLLAYAIGQYGPHGLAGLSLSQLIGYFSWLGQVLQGDLGSSLVTGQAIARELANVIPPTLQLVLCSLLLALLLGLPAGILAALNRGRWPDRVIQSLAFVGFSVPHFWWAYLLIIIFCIGLGWLPMAGQLSLRYEIIPVTGFSLIDTLFAPAAWRREVFIDALQHLLLPTLVLATVPMTVIIRVMRNSMIDVMEQQYIKVARAKGMSTARIIWRHGLRNAIYPVIKVLGLQMNSLLTTAIITETIFGWPGIGNWLVNAVGMRDYPAIQGGLLAVSCFIILTSILFDLIYILSNPVSRKEFYATARRI